MSKPKTFYETHGRFKGQAPLTNKEQIEYHLSEVQGCLDELKACPTKSLCDRLYKAMTLLRMQF